MARNAPSGDGHRKGAVRRRIQVRNPVNGNWTKIDMDSGRFVRQKRDGKPFKGVRRK
jgi:hypothetical protein